VLSSMAEVAMAQLLVRNLEDEVVAELKRRAARSGRSVEAEHREILRTALRRGPDRQSLKDLLKSMPPTAKDFDFARLRQEPRRLRP
jgi:plasmid stability protein